MFGLAQETCNFCWQCRRPRTEEKPSLDEYDIIELILEIFVVVLNPTLS